MLLLIRKYYACERARAKLAVSGRVKGGAEERAVAVLKRWEGVRPQEQKGLYAKGAPAADFQLGAPEGRLRVVPAKRGGRKGRGH